MIFNEKFYESKQEYNKLLHVRLAGELFPDKTYFIERCDSETGTIIYVKSGKLAVNFEGATEILEKGVSAVFPPNINYQIYSDTENPPNILWVNIRGDLFKKNCDVLFSKNKICVAFCDAQSEIEDLIDDIVKNPDFSLICKTVFNILIKIHESPSFNSDEGRNYDSIKGQFDHYISNTLHNGFNINDMAEHFDISKYKLMRLFKSKFNTPPYRYYENLRIDIAKSLLLNLNLTIEDIAFRLNFTDRNHFTSSFIKNTGISPAKYRKAKENEKTKHTFPDV